MAWRGDTLPPDPLALIDRVRGAASETSRTTAIPAKWMLAGVKKTDQIKKLEPGSDSIRTERALIFVRGDRFHQDTS